MGVVDVWLPDGTGSEVQLSFEVERSTEAVEEAWQNTADLVSGVGGTDAGGIGTAGVLDIGAVAEPVEVAVGGAGNCPNPVRLWLCASVQQFSLAGFGE